MPAALITKSTTLGLRGLIGGLRLLGPVRASNFGGRLGRSIGPWLPSSRVADRNLADAFPGMDAATRRATVRQVWDNIGRNVAELPHLASFGRTDSGPGWEIVGEEHLAVPGRGQALFFSGHLGNWEMVLPIARGLGLEVAGFYRAASNRAVDDQIQAMRQSALGGRVSMFAKGARGARLAMAHLGRGGSLGLLVDQKMNDGIAVPFFGRDAMTAPALAQFALRFGAPILPVHVERLGPARFRMVCEAPLPVRRTSNRAEDTLAILTAMNATLERWIRADPGAWLWLHRRWPKEGQGAALDPFKAEP
jgi:KDO2-lipid IV(A) lauroyltransferase